MPAHSGSTSRWSVGTATAHTCSTGSTKPPGCGGGRGSPTAGVLAPPFPLKEKERSIPGAIRDFGALLNHVHLSDSNRLAPGLGHVDFTEVLQALRDVGYGGVLAFELIPALPNILEDGPGLTDLDDVARQAIDHMCEVERRLVRSQQEMHQS